MTDLRALQAAFTAGELSPALWARVDLDKYGSGLKTALNVFIHAHGGASNRAGLEFIRETKTSAKESNLLPFQFNTEQSYILEAGDLYFRIFRDGGLILSGGAPFEVVTPYTAADVGDLVFVQEADVMYITHPSHAPRKLSRLADDNWTLETVSFAPKTVAPANLNAVASYTFPRGDGDTISFRVTSVGEGGEESAGSATVSRFFRYENPAGRYVQITWNPVSGAASYRVYKTGGESDNGLMAEVLGTEAEISAISGDPYQLVPGTSASGAPAVPSGVKAELKFGKTYTYRVAAVNADTGEESLPSDGASVENDMSFKGNKNRLSWDAVVGASAYIIYREDNGLFGYVGRSETTTFVDENITADLADGPQSARNPFDAVGKYPRACAFVEQRLALAATNEDPQAVFLSQSANYENFGVSTPAKQSDAVTFRIRARQVNEIRAMIALRGLMLLTSGGEFLVSGGTQADAIAPNAIRIDPQGYRGSSRVQPIIVGNTVLFAQERGGVIRDLSYEFSQDSFAGNDLTILARHLFEGRSIKSWAFSQAPYSMAWVILDNGALCTLTYVKEHSVWAWTRQSSGAAAKFERVTWVSEGQEDVLYFIVQRTIGGVEKRYIERLHSRDFSDIRDAFFVDCGLTYSGEATTVISGLDHLEGQSVVALADGNVVRNLVVSEGSVTLPFAASKVHVGLPYVAALQTLDLDLGQVNGLGTVQGRMKSVGEVTMRVERTRGIFVGPRDGERGDDWLVEYKQRSTEAWDEAIQLYTGDIRVTPHWDWSTGGNTWVKQFDPLPMTILSIMPDVKIGR